MTFFRKFSLRKYLGLPAWIEKLVIATFFVSVILSATLVWKSLLISTPFRPLYTITMADQQYRVEVVQTPDKIRQGLSDRNEIGSDGMLFVLPQSSRPSFWMYKMRFSLDFIWIEEGKVVAVHKNIPPATANMSLQDIPTVQPDVPASYVLEVPAGFIDAKGIQIGDTVSFE